MAKIETTAATTETKAKKTRTVKPKTLYLVASEPFPTSISVAKNADELVSAMDAAQTAQTPFYSKKFTLGVK